MNSSRLSRNDILELREIGRSSSARAESKSVLVEGFRAISGAKSSGAQFYYVLAENTDDIRLENIQCQIIQVDSKTLKSIATTTNPQGVVALCKMPILELDLIETGHLKDKPIFVLDHVSDPGNVGTIIRSASAFGIGAVLLVGGCDPFHPKVVRSSAGMIFGCPTISIQPFLLESVLSGRKVYTANASKDQDLKDTEFSQNAVLAFGNEANGFQTEFFSKNTHDVSISMEESCESLNVAMTATIMAYQLSISQS